MLFRYGSELPLFPGLFDSGIRNYVGNFLFLSVLCRCRNYSINITRVGVEFSCFYYLCSVSMDFEKNEK